MNWIGEIAGLSASFLFAITAIIYTNVGRLVGSQITNRMRISFALLYLLILNLILFREPLPFSADSSRWAWLMISGIIGLALGDMFLFQSFISVGARLGSLLLSLAPIFGSVIAWVFFGETLTFMQIVGITLALAGIGWVVMSHEEPENTPRGHTQRGVIFGILAGLGQAAGFVLSKQGMTENFPPFQANAVRMLAAAIFVWLWTVLQGQAGATFSTIRKHPRALWLIAIGAFIGPVLGVTLSLLAVQRVEVGIASTLTALSPVAVIPISYFMFNEKVGWRAIAGTLLAVAGVAMLFLA
jgi:drug/metabolite transporter (DMT)-like permease